jgi:hypothetical protein
VKEIPLSKGKVAIVDDEMFEYLNQWSWYCQKSGYAARSYRKDGGFKHDRMHRVIINAAKGDIVDHINGDKLDNRKENLRLATPSQNNYNRGLASNSTSGFKGVTWNKKTNKWIARIYVDRKGIHLGSFEYKVDAALAYNEAAFKYHGEFANYNQIEEVDIYK